MNSDLRVVFATADWHDEALCARAPAAVREQFTRESFNARRDAKNPHYVQALLLCGRCPVAKKCREWNDKAEKYMFSHLVLGGIFGGETPLMRVARRKYQMEMSHVKEGEVR